MIHASAASPIVCPIHDETQVGAARRRARLVADTLELDDVLREHVAIVATELSANMLKHANGGELLIQQITDGCFHGLELLAVDRGPGMRDISRSLEDGHSTQGTPGNGLGAARRLSNVFDLFSEPGRGTVVLSRIGTVTGVRAASLRVGAVASVAPGETVSGDQWAMTLGDGSSALVMADGLGHGMKAYEAARTAVQTFVSHAQGPPGEYLSHAHDAMRATRGAALAMARFDVDATSITFAGVGNIAGVIVKRDGRQHGMVSNNGTVGADTLSIKEFSYEWNTGEPLVMHTDGLQTRWSLADRPGLASCHPAIVAAVLHRDFLRGRDDATVVVMVR